MNVWSAIKSAGEWLVGSGNESKGFEIVKGVGTWIDKQQFTNQEKAEDSMERAKRYGEFLEQVLQENTQRSRTRRSLALLIIRWWLGMLTFSALVYKADPAWSAYIFKVASYDEVAYLVLGIGAFFWGAHLMRTRSSKNGSS